MKSRDQILLEEVYQSIYEAKENYANQGVIFRKNGNKDVGCCIGVAHGKSIKLSKYLIERIHNISDLRFYAEGTAAKNPGLEPGMLPFLNTNFPGFGIESKSWDDITEEQKKGTANPKNNVYWLFANHRFNKLIAKHFSQHTEGTMLDAIVNSDHCPKNAPQNSEERKKWISKHMAAAGFLEDLSKRYNKKELYNILDRIEYSVFPNQQFPDTSTYLGKQVHIAECERNQTIYNLMGSGGGCFAGSGHLIELKQQFPNLEIVCEENI